jgi:RNA polymerase sigma-70 factor (ECF subfamily)
MNSILSNTVIQLKNDNREAYKYVFRTYYSELYNIAFRYTGNKEDSKDLVQSTFIKLWEKRKELNETRTLEGFLFTVHKNNCLDYLRLRKAKTPYLAGDPTFDSDTNTPFDQIISKELEIKINKAILDLPAKCREIFECSRIKGMKYAEIAQKLNLSVKTVEGQMSIALERLRKTLIEYLPLLLFLTF